MAKVKIRRVMLRGEIPHPVTQWYVEIECTREELSAILRDLLGHGNEADKAEWREGEGLFLRVHGEFLGRKGTFHVIIRVE